MCNIYFTCTVTQRAKLGTGKAGYRATTFYRLEVLSKLKVTKQKVTTCKNNLCITTYSMFDHSCILCTDMDELTGIDKYTNTSLSLKIKDNRTIMVIVSYFHVLLFKSKVYN